MTNKTPEGAEQPENVRGPEAEPDIVDDLDIEDLVPKMEVNQPLQEENLIEDEVLLTLYEEILQNERSDRIQTDEILMDFINMVMNDGESSSASKEAIVNLMKIKSDIGDKMTKIADLMTRLKMRDRSIPGYIAQQQNNKIVFDGSKRNFLKRIEKMGKKNDKQA